LAVTLQTNRLLFETERQAAVGDLDAVIEDHSALPEAFNASIGVPRLVLLVSPTCPVCLDGVRVVIDSLALLGTQPRVAIHVVWVAVLSEDNRAAATAGAEMFPTALGAKHYWDGALDISKGFHAALELERRSRKVAWDV
jgi:hypothetical protein